MHHAAHYYTDLASPPKKMRPQTGRKKIHRRIFLDDWVTGFEPDINLEGSKAGPRLGFDSCPRVTESGTTRDAPVQGQGSSHALEAPPDVFEAKREVDEGIPLKGGIEPSDLIARNRDPCNYSLAFLRAPPWPLANSYRMEHGLPLEFPVNSSPETVKTRPMRVVRRFPPLLLFPKKGA
jgi:hypothetical protein